MVTEKMKKFAELLVLECHSEGLKSIEVYHSEALGHDSYTITAFEDDGTIWQAYGGDDGE